MPDAKPRYKKILLKVSGEVLMGDQPFGIDTDTLERTAQDIAEVVATGFLIELGFLDGRARLDVPAEALMTFD